MKNKTILFITDSISGGVGRVLRILLQGLSTNNMTCYLLCINQETDDIINALDGFKGCKVFGQDSFAKVSLNIYQKMKKVSIHLAYSIICRLKEIFFSTNFDFSLILKFYYSNYNEVLFLKRIISQKNINAEIVFLNNPIFLSLLAYNSKSKLIISERNDPNQFVNTKTTMAFIRKMYPKANEMVFQSPDAMKWYQKNTIVKGRVIFNPIKPDLPERFIGKRKKKIVNFCRISSQKNLLLLVNAFELFANDFPDYELYIYGDAVGNGSEGYIEDLIESINQLNCKGKIFILPAQKEIHNLVKDYAMFVSSSDFEGMSNSMLEAMAIGLPTICTDCPVGGARAIINDHENGILVPINDVQAMYKAMCEIADNPKLAEKISKNGTKIREKLSVEKIIDQWMEIISE